MKIPKFHPFPFTLEELRTLHHQLLVARRLGFRKLGLFDEFFHDDRAQNANARWIWRMLWLLRRGSTSSDFSERELWNIHASAFVAYNAARRLGKSKEQARHSALLYTQLALEKITSISEITGISERG